MISGSDAKQAPPGTAPPGSPSADALKLLGSWAATHEAEFAAADASVRTTAPARKP